MKPRETVASDQGGCDDYRYFPEPDLPPLASIRLSWSRLRASLPELPDARRERFERSTASRRLTLRGGETRAEAIRSRNMQPVRGTAEGRPIRAGPSGRELGDRRRVCALRNEGEHVSSDHPAKLGVLIADFVMATGRSTGDRQGGP